MIRFFDYFKDTFSFALFSLEYQMISEENTAQLYFKDDIQVLKTEEGVDLRYRRRLFTNPDDKTVLQVVYRILFENNGKMDTGSLTCEEIHDALYDNALDALNQVAARMSLVVGELIFLGYGQPLILPPNVIKA